MTHLTILCARFQLSDIQVLWPWHHCYTSEHYFSNQRFNNCSPTVIVGFVKLMSDSFCGSRVFKMNIQFCCRSSVIFRNIPSQCTMISFCQCWFLPAVPLCWCCLPIICVCRHVCRSGHSQYI
jgi:hypothetical protein